MLCLSEKCSFTLSKLRFFSLRQIPKSNPFYLVIARLKNLGSLVIIYLSSLHSLSSLNSLKYIAVVAQLVEHRLPKPRVAGSSPVYRSALLEGVGLSNASLARPFQGSGV